MPWLDARLTKWLSLGVLVVQNSALILIMRYTRSSVDQDHLYLASTAVVMSELVKCSVSLAVLFHSLDVHTLSRFARLLYQEMILQWHQASRLAVPAIMYLIQNQLQYVAATHLDAATFQVTYQLKILTTALFSVLLLGRSLALKQWLALTLLTIGIGLVVLPSTSGNDNSAMVIDHQGLMAVLLACLLSGMAGVYFEKLVKASPKQSPDPKRALIPMHHRSDPTISVSPHQQFWLRNLQLSFFSVWLGLVVLVYFQDGPQIRALGFFVHYTHWTWLVILIQALGGILVAMVVKFADNILKGFATSLSIIISTIVTATLFHVPLSTTFLLGTSLVIYATYLYGRK
ncbi:nucleotide-sugar transporter [Hesseltinella vesiculosa]|uniref:Nucleotide-sugar transporter n=1 Tax=Hesseltinella vesiculosa TaxID=101127 RepID=A0A1X2GMK1_9FUNG|nr:nucleotide-sugar transporter [Hesseltinella vesiculosa]